MSYVILSRIKFDKMLNFWNYPLGVVYRNLQEADGANVFASFLTSGHV